MRHCFDLFWNVTYVLVWFDESKVQFKESVESDEDKSLKMWNQEVQTFSIIKQESFFFWQAWIRDIEAKKFEPFSVKSTKIGEQKSLNCKEETRGLVHWKTFAQLLIMNLLVIDRTTIISRTWWVCIRKINTITQFEWPFLNIPKGGLPRW